MFTLWDGLSYSQKVEECKKFLIDNGYQVWGPITHKSEVKTIPQLVRFFYDTMARYRTDVQIFHAAPSKIDRGVMANLVKSRMALGMSRERALSECCLFIEKLFEFESYLLDRPITSTRVLGQEKMAWLTERVWQISEGYDALVNEEKNKQWFEETYRKQEEVPDEEILKAIERLDRILKKEEDA